MALETMIVVLTLGLGLALYAQRQLDRRAWPAWLALDALSLESVAAQRASLLQRAQLVTVTLDGVDQERRAGHQNEAVVLHGLSVTTLERFARDVTARLREWSDAAHALAALYPLSPLRVTDFHVNRLRLLAAIWRVLHGIAITSRERFLLRTAVLVRSLQLLSGFWLKARVPPRNARWKVPAVVANDVQALARAAGDTYHALAHSRLAQHAAQRAQWAKG